MLLMTASSAAALLGLPQRPLGLVEQARVLQRRRPCFHARCRQDPATSLSLQACSRSKLDLDGATTRVGDDDLHGRRGQGAIGPGPRSPRHPAAVPRPSRCGPTSRDASGFPVAPPNAFRSGSALGLEEEMRLAWRSRTSGCGGCRCAGLRTVGRRPIRRWRGREQAGHPTLAADDNRASSRSARSPGCSGHRVAVASPAGARTAGCVAFCASRMGVSFVARAHPFRTARRQRHAKYLGARVAT